MLNRNDAIKLVLEYIEKLSYASSKNFRKNLLTLVVTNQINDIKELSIAQYDTIDNVIEIIDESLFGHELYHVASNDISKKTLSGICQNINGNPFSIALNEGITQYFFIKTFKPNKYSYQFETFVASFLVFLYGEDIYKYYFLNDGEMFIKQFPNRNTIFYLMVTLDSYQKCFNYIYEQALISKSNITNLDSNDPLVKSVINLGKTNVHEITNILLRQYHGSTEKLITFISKFSDSLDEVNIVENNYYNYLKNKIENKEGEENENYCYAKCKRRHKVIK